jgi:hypothetical protein
VAALEEIGVPRGVPANAGLSRFWPQGERVAFSAHRLADGKTFALDALLDDAEKAHDPVLDRAPVAPLGARDAGGAPLAACEAPHAVFALYNHAPSLLQLDAVLDQSQAYGRFRVREHHRPGDLFAMTLSYRGAPRASVRTVTLEKGADLAGVLETLRADKEKEALYVRLAFAPDVPLREARRAAEAFAHVDGAGIRMSGAAKGQFYYRAFLPEEEWRRRAGRIFQPFEIHIGTNGVHRFVHIQEDYSGSGIDPVLKPREVPFAAWTALPPLVARTRADKIDVCFVFAPPQTPVGALTPVLSVLSPRIKTFYVFAGPPDHKEAPQGAKKHD